MPLTLQTALAQIDAEQAVARRSHAAEMQRQINSGFRVDLSPLHELSSELRMQMARRRVAEFNADTQANRDADLRRALNKVIYAQGPDALRADRIHAGMSRDADRYRGEAEAFLGVAQRRAA